MDRAVFSGPPLQDQAHALTGRAQPESVSSPMRAAALGSNVLLAPKTVIAQAAAIAEGCPAELLSRISTDLIAGPVHVQACDLEDKYLVRLTIVLCARLGEETPGVLTAVMHALAAIIDIADIGQLRVPLEDLTEHLPHFLPFLEDAVDQAHDEQVHLARFALSPPCFLCTYLRLPGRCPS